MKQKYLPIIYLVIGLNGAVDLFKNPDVPLSLFPWPIWLFLILCSLKCGKNFWDFHSLPPIALGPRSPISHTPTSIWLRLVILLLEFYLIGRTVFWMFTSTADASHSTTIVLAAALGLSAVAGLQQFFVRPKTTE